jgi:hypothetical protein
MRPLVFLLVLASLSCARKQSEDEDNLRVRDTASAADTLNPSDTLDRARRTAPDSALPTDSTAGRQ